MKTVNKVNSSVCVPLKYDKIRMVLLTDSHSIGRIMDKQPEELSDAEKKTAYVMGYDVEGPTLVEKLIARWNAYVALRRARLSKVPLLVFLRSIKDGEEIES